MTTPTRQKVVIVGAGPVGSLAALYAASRGDDVEVYELRAGKTIFGWLETFPDLGDLQGVKMLKSIFFFYKQICETPLQFLWILQSRST